MIYNLSTLNFNYVSVCLPIFYCLDKLTVIYAEFSFRFSVSPPGGDFSDPVTSAMLGIVHMYMYII